MKHEFDLAITQMFGGFSKIFYHEYHKLVPQEPGFENRKLLYELFHYLNHWYSYVVALAIFQIILYI